MTGCTVSRYEQFETSPETIEQELRPAVCERRQTLKENYCIDMNGTNDVNCCVGKFSTEQSLNIIQYLLSTCYGRTLG